MKVIAIEEHFLTAETQRAWQQAGLDLIDPGVRSHSADIDRRLLELADERIALMDESGVDVQVLSLTTPALHDLGSQSIAIAQRANDAMAEAAARYPGRFQGLATLAVSSPEQAALEFERCVNTLGFKGAMLCGRVGDKNLDASELLPIFQVAHSLAVPLLLHPRTPAQPVRDAYYAGFNSEIDAVLASYGLGWHYDAGMQFIRLLLAGHFDAMPGLQIILGHWGEVVLFFYERLAALNRVSGLEHEVAHYFHHNLYVTASGMFLPHYLARAASIVGEDRLLFSTDYPYQYRPGGDARRFIQQCGLDEEGQSKFASANWLRLTRSPSPPALAAAP